MAEYGVGRSPIRRTFVVRLVGISGTIAVGLFLLAGCTVKFGTVPSSDDGGSGDARFGCGNGVLDVGEMCDGTDFGGQDCQSAVHMADGRLQCTDDCLLDLSDCHACGNGKMEGSETCDDENRVDGDGCSADCAAEPGWTCRGEPSQCEETCGNDVIDEGENCDDGNHVGGDGCGLDCRVEDGWQCGDDQNGSVGACSPICGDGMLVGGENCDDGNRVSGDGCSEDCVVEPYFHCTGTPSQCVCRVYVSHAVTFSPDGLTWGTAEGSIQAGLDRAAQVGAPCQIWVAGGTYRAYRVTASDTIELIDGVELYGGFSGDEIHLDERDWEANETIVEGRQTNDATEAVNTIFTANGVTSRIDGLTITEARYGENGGGLKATDATLDVVHCHFLHNRNYGGGAGAYVQGGTARFEDCTFATNQTGLFQGGDGGGLWASGTVTVKDCVFNANHASHQGGALYANGGLTVEGCTFQGNDGPFGCALSLDGSSGVTVLRSRFVDNSYHGHFGAVGGGLFAKGGKVAISDSLFLGNEVETGPVAAGEDNALISFVNCTMAGNRARNSEGFLLGGQSWHFQGVASFSVTNSISWSNDVPGFGNPSQTTVRYSDVEGGFAGTAVLSDDPMFDTSLPNYSLALGSPCIDAGDGDVASGSDLDGTARYDDPNQPNTGVGQPPYVDMGAFEYHP